MRVGGGVVCVPEAGAPVAEVGGYDEDGGWVGEVGGDDAAVALLGGCGGVANHDGD